MTIIWLLRQRIVAFTSAARHFNRARESAEHSVVRLTGGNFVEEAFRLFNAFLFVHHLRGGVHKGVDHLKSSAMICMRSARITAYLYIFVHAGNLQRRHPASRPLPTDEKVGRHAVFISEHFLQKRLVAHVYSSQRHARVVLDGDERMADVALELRIDFVFGDMRTRLQLVVWRQTTLRFDILKLAHSFLHVGLLLRGTLLACCCSAFRPLSRLLCGSICGRWLEFT